MKSVIFSLVVFAALLYAHSAVADVTADLKSKVSELNAEEQAALLLLLDQLATPAPADEKVGAKENADGKLLEATSKVLMDAFKANDLQTVLSYFSDNFTSPRFQDKASLESLLDLAKSSNYLGNLKFEDKDMKITLDGSKATVGPVLIVGSFGTVTSVFHCTKENEKWAITGLELEGFNF